MKEFDKLSNLNKVLVKLTIVFLFYGYLCRTVGLYFFWESKTIGWTLLLITIVSILIQRIKAKKAANKKKLSEKILLISWAALISHQRLKVVTESTLKPICNPIRNPNRNPIFSISMTHPADSSARHDDQASSLRSSHLEGRQVAPSHPILCHHHPSESLRWVARVSSRPRFRCRLCSGEATRQWRRSHPGQCAWQNLVLRAKRRAARMAMSSYHDAYGSASSDETGSNGGRLVQAMVEQAQVRGSNSPA